MLLCSDAAVTLTSSARGGICPREEVTLTCTVTGGALLEWSSTAFSGLIIYVEDDPVGRPIERGIFTATLISEAANPTPPLADLTSTLRVTATPQAMLNGTVVTCSDQFNPRSITFTIAGVFIFYCSCQCCKKCIVYVNMREVCVVCVCVHTLQKMLDASYK